MNVISRNLNKMMVPALALGLMGMATLSNAQTFAQQNTTTGNQFTFLNTGTMSTSGLTLDGNPAANTPASLNINQGFYFTTVAPLLGYAGPTGPVSSINATLTINNAVVQGPTSALTFAGNYDTTLQDVTAGPTFRYTVNGTQTIGGFTFLNGANLLSAFLVGPFQFSAEGVVGHTANIIQSNGGGTTLAYSSDYLNLAGQQGQTLSYAFNDASSANSVNTTDLILNTNTYNGTGIFSLNVPASVPEPGSVALLIGMGISGSAFFLRRKQTK